MPGKGRLAKTVVTYGVKYGPLLYEAVKHGREPAQRALQKAFTRQTDRRKATQHAATVIEGSILRAFHRGEPVWVVFSADTPLASYPPVEVPLATLLEHVDLDQRIRPGTGGPRVPMPKVPSLPSLPNLPKLARKALGRRDET